MSSESSCRRFSLDYIKKVTDNFADPIGKGGYGTVYRGILSEKHTSTKVAVKRLSEGSKQGDPQFRAEIEVLPKCHHRHIVPLVGYCDEMNEKILVYEYAPRGSLFHYLHRSNTPFFTMERRLEICLGVARGLDHLHSGIGFKIIHRDVKTANVLLYENWVAKISDLGLAKVSLVAHTGLEEIAAHVRGTRGYIDPQYTRSCQPSSKFDVYAFGVVLLEVLCRRRAWEEGHLTLVEWALPHVKKDRFGRIIDEKLMKDVRPDCLRSCATIITRCLEGDLRKRPSMSQVVADLVSALAWQRGTHPSSTVMGSEILNHFNRPHPDTTIERDGDGHHGRTMSPTTASTSIERKKTEIYLQGTEDRIVLYYTSLRGLTKIYHDCQDVRLIVSEFGKQVDERDVYLDPGYKKEIQEVFGGKSFKLPQLFIRGNLIGGMDEVRQLNEVGKLEKLVRSFPAKISKDNGFGCRRCENARFVPCPEKGCNNASCGKCNENGLARCPSCC